MLIFVIILFLAESYMVMKSRELFLSAKDEMINKNLDSVDSYLEYYKSQKLIDYMVEHEAELDYDPLTDMDPSPEILKASEKMYEMQSKYESPDMFMNLMNDKEKWLFGCLVKNVIHNIIGYSLNDKNCQSTSLLVPLDDNHLFVMTVVFSSYENTDYSEDELENMRELSNLEFGEIIETDWAKNKDLQKAIENQENRVVFQKMDIEELGSFYTGYKPIFDKDGNLLYLMCVEYDYSDVYSDVVSNLREKIVRDFLITIIIAGAIILVAVYLVALRPLRKVKNTLDVYMENKDCDEVEERLGDFKTRNEIGALADGVVEFAREIEQYTADNVILATETAKVKTELDLAASIQSGSLIKDFPKSDYFEVFASMTPAKEVGGDFYDIFELDENRMCFVIADVSGKGMPAALYMMAAMTAIRNNAPFYDMPSEVIAKVNNDLCERNVMDMFVTIWLGILDLRTGVMFSSNAGHECPAINITGEFEMLRDKHSLVAGGMKRVKYFDCAVQLKEGNRVFVYTDGVPEATNANVEMFREDKMLDALNSDPAAEPEQLLTNVKDAVDDFVGEAEQFDDLTMMCIKLKGLKSE